MPSDSGGCTIYDAGMQGDQDVLPHNDDMLEPRSSTVERSSDHGFGCPLTRAVISPPVSCGLELFYRFEQGGTCIVALGQHDLVDDDAHIGGKENVLVVLLGPGPLNVGHEAFDAQEL